MATIRALLQGVLNAWAANQDAHHKKAFSFGGQQAHGGERWKPRKKFAPHPILFKTGALKASISFSLSGLRVTFESDSPYAVFHQFGTSDLPVRKILDVTDTDIGDLRQQIEQLNGVTVTE